MRLFVIAVVYFTVVAGIRQQIKGTTFFPYLLQSIVIILPFIFVAVLKKTEYLYSAILAVGITPYKTPLTLGYVAVFFVLLAVIFLRGKAREILRNVHKTLIPLFLYTAALLLISYGTADVVSMVLFTISFMTIPLVFTFYLKIRVREERDAATIMAQTFLLLTAQLATVLVIPLIFWRPALYLEAVNSAGKIFVQIFGVSPLFTPGNPDANIGSMNHAHYVGFAMVILSAWNGILYFLKKKKGHLALALVSIFVFLMTETVHAVPGISVGLTILLLCFSAMRFQIHRISFVSATLLFLIVVTPLLFYWIAYENLSSMKETRKALFVRAVAAQYHEMPVHTILFGYGAGTYASRAACIRLPLRYGRVSAGPKYHYAPERVIEPYGKALAACAEGKSGYTAETEESGLVSIPLELGLVGTALFILFLFFVVQDSVKLVFFAENRSYKALGLLAVFVIALIHTTNIFKPAWEMTEVLFFVWPVLILPQSIQSLQSVRNSRTEFVPEERTLN